MRQACLLQTRRRQRDSRMQVCPAELTCVHMICPCLFCPLPVCCIHVAFKAAPAGVSTGCRRSMHLLTLQTLAALTQMRSEVQHWQGCLPCCCRYCCCWLIQQPGSGCGTRRSGSRLPGLHGKTANRIVSLRLRLP